MSISLKDQIAAVERCISDFREWRDGPPDALEHQTYVALKAVAADLNARKPAKITTTLSELERLLDNARAQPERISLGDGTTARNQRNIATHAAVGQFVVGRWPVIRQALQAFESWTLRLDREAG